MVADLALFYAVDEFIGVFQAADYGDFYLLAVMGDAALLEACYIADAGVGNGTYRACGFVIGEPS